MTEITDEKMNVIVSDGLAFVKSITSAYGADEGMKLWDTIASTLDPVIKGKIFFAMLTGSHENRVTLMGAGVGGNKITCIRIIRQYTGMGLVEAKNAYESAVHHASPVQLAIDPTKRQDMIDDLRKHGMVVT